MDMGAQVNRMSRFVIPEQSTLIPIKPTMLSTRPASYIEYCIRGMRKRDDYKCGAYEFFNSEQMIATLYILDKADELYMDIVERLKANNQYRFIAAKWGKFVKKSFDAYQRNRDKYTSMDPVDFADLIDIVDRMMGEKVKAVIDFESKRMANNGLTGYWNEVNSRVMTFYEFIWMAKTCRDAEKRSVESVSFGTFKLFDFIDYNGIISVTMEYLYKKARELHFNDTSEVTEDDVRCNTDLINALKDAKNRSVIANIFKALKEGRFKDE